MSWLFSQVLVEEYLGDISSDGEQSVQSSGNPSQLAYCAPDKMTVFSRLSRFGMTYKPLTDDLGEALLTLYRGVSHAKTSLPQEKEQGSRESEAECGEKWRGSFTRYDPDSFSWKTHQCSLLEDLDKFSETWPKWGLMRNGECWEQQMSELRTSETESGLLPTPNARDWKDGKTAGKRKSPGLGVVVHWPTPRTPSGGPDNSANKLRPSGHQGTTNLQGAVGGKLNPMWVEWLMGWPLGWTDLKPLETDKFQKWQDEHGRH
jgi:hypothetical protein